MPADFYTDTAASVQESVGGGVDIDVNDITGVVVDDDCDTNASNIDNAQIDREDKKPSEKKEACKKKISFESTSNIDEASVVSKDENNTNLVIQDKEQNNVNDTSKIDEAQVNLDELESQIEPIKTNPDNSSSSELHEVTGNSKLDEVKVESIQEESLSSPIEIVNELDSQLSGIDNVTLTEAEKGDDIIFIQSMVSHHIILADETMACSLETSRIDDADIQLKDVEANVNETQYIFDKEKCYFTDDSSRLDLALASPRDQEDSNNDDISIEATKEESETSSSRIDNAASDSKLKEKSDPLNIETENLSDSRIDDIKLSTNEAEINVISPSPLNENSSITPAKCVKHLSYNCI